MVKKDIQDKFNFFVPAIFEKSGETGEMKISGICSDLSEDVDEEELDPSGFDYKPLLDTGYINWNHQANKSSSAILGRPTAAKVINNGRSFYIEGILYKGLEEARNVYNLATVLQQEDPSRQLGWSIEGQATERDPLNPKKIRKARITGVAITHCPKNHNTFLSIVKGEYQDSFQDDEENEDEKEKSMDTTNVPMPESVEGKPKEMVKKDKLIDQKTISKSQVFTTIFGKYTSDFTEAKNIFSFIQKVSSKINNDMNTFTPESLEKAFDALDFSIKKSEDEITKPLEPTDGAKVDEKEGKEPATVDPIDTLPKVVKKSEEPTIEGNNERLKVVNETLLEKSMKGEDITDEVNEIQLLQKSNFDLNELQKAQDTDLGKKGLSDEDKGFIKGMLSCGMDESKINDELIKKGIDLTVHKDEVSSICSEWSKNKDGGSVSQQSTPIVKSEEFTTLTAQPLYDIEKSFSVLEKRIEKSNSVHSRQFSELGLAMDEKFAALSTILKSSLAENERLTGELNTISESLEKSNHRIEEIASVPMPRKSVTSAREVERFQKSEVVDENAYSISNPVHRKELVDRLFIEIQKSQQMNRSEPLLEKACMDIEISKSIPSDLYPRLRSLGIAVRQ